MAIPWAVMAAGDNSETEIDRMLAENPDNVRRADLLHARAWAMLSNPLRKSDLSAPLAAIDEFIQAAPKDQRGVSLLFQAVMKDKDSACKTQTLKRIVENYGDTESGKMAKGQLRLADAIGTPFELSFTDAISGKLVSMANLKGKVVVIDFWATWCGPCVAEMPELKKFYADYKDKGVEFIGISLDQPGDGLDKLKALVAKNGITWPQYYQGNGWSSDFSSNWGISHIPCAFVIDTAGKLYSTEAHGQLGWMIPAMLIRRGK